MSVKDKDIKNKLKVICNKLSLENPKLSKEEKKIVGLCNCIQQFNKKRKREYIEEEKQMKKKVKYTPIINGSCYICSSPLKDNNSVYYDTMCRYCGKINFNKRNVIVDLKEKVAIVTGGRIKIGFYTALQLLKCGAKVIVTTRFSADCYERYRKEETFDEWADNLEIYQLDFLKFIQIKKFIDDVKKKYPTIDILINNAAQTIQRPPEFYRNLLKNSTNTSNSNIKQIYGNYFEDNNLLDYNYKNSIDIIDNTAGTINMVDIVDTTNTVKNIDDVTNLCKKYSSLYNRESNHLDIANKAIKNVFPQNVRDEHDQQIDLRHVNSWTKTVSTINPMECAEIFMINSIAPFYIIGALKDNMKKNIGHSWIINVSSMEGSFSRKNKPSIHPHTNMGKAALNMITKTCSREYNKVNIIMVSVDTGWNTIEEPLSYNVTSPLDCIDGAARILDPIFSNLTKHGLFYKNFTETTW